MKSKKIALMVTQIVPYGGTETFMKSIIRYLQDIEIKKNYQLSTLLSLNDITDNLKHIKKLYNFECAAGSGGDKKNFIYKSFLKLSGKDILIVGNPGLAPVAYILKKLGLIKSYIIIIHGVESWSTFPRLLRLSFLGSTKIVATTIYNAKTCAKYNAIPFNKFTIIPISINKNNLKYSNKFELKGTIKLLYVGRQRRNERYKGLDELVDIFHKIINFNDNAHLNIIGYGDDHERLVEKVNSNGLTQNITFYKNINDADLNTAYRECDIFILPSDKEGFGIVFLEAMIHSKPCIGGNEGGTPEVIKDGITGVLVSRRNLKELENAIITLIVDKNKRLKMGEEGRIHAEKYFNDNIVSSKYLAMFDSIF